MVLIQDSTQSFTITLSALLEGLGNITYMEIANMTQGISAEWADGVWITPLPSAVESDSILVLVEVTNNGSATDTLFGEFVSADVTPPEALIQTMLAVDVGMVRSVQWSFTMPPNNISITINAGHAE